MKSRIEDLECSKDGELNSSTQIWLTISHLTWMKNSSFGKSEGEGEVALSQVFTKWNGQESEKEGGEGVFIPTPEI